MTNVHPETPTWDVFVCYAREDLAFVRELAVALRAQGQAVWVDLDGLYAGEQWWGRICSEIEAANVIVFVISPASARSRACRAEIEHAARNRKRFIPLLYEHAGKDQLPQEVASSHWLLDFAQGRGFSAAIEALLVSLRTDVEWVRSHTRWLLRAADWDRRGRPPELLLTGDHLAEAERWLNGRQSNTEPAVSTVQETFIKTSRQAHWFVRARELSSQGDHDMEALQAAVTAAGLDLALQPAGFATLLACTSRLRRAYPLGGHSNQHWNVRASADGSRAVCDGKGGSTQLWDLTGLAPRLLTPLDTPDGRPFYDEASVFSPDGARVLTRRAETFGLWDAQTGAEVLRVSQSPHRLSSIKFSPDGKLLAGAARSIAWVWDAGTGELQNTLTSRGVEPFREASVSSDGRNLLAMGAQAVQVYDLETENLRFQITTGKRYEFTYARYSPDGTRLVTANGTRRARLWSAADGTPLSIVGGASSEIERAWFSTAGRFLLTGSQTLGARVWAIDGTPLPNPQSADWVSVFAFCPAERILLSTQGDRSGSICVWDLTEGKQVDTLRCPRTEVTAIEWASDGQSVLTASRDGIIRIWSVNPWSCHMELDAKAGAVDQATFLDSGREILAGYRASVARRWRLQDSLRMAEMSGEALRIEFSSDSASAAVGFRGERPVSICDASTLEPRASLGQAYGSPNLPTFSPDGRWIATGSRDGRFHLVEAQSLSIARDWAGPPRSYQLRFSPDSKRVLALGEGCKIWEVSGNAAGLALGDELHRVTRAAFARNGAALCVAFTEYRNTAARVFQAIRHTAEIIDASTGARLADLGEYRNSISEINCSPLGDRIVIVESGCGVVLNALTGQVVCQLGKPGEDWVSSAEFSPDGTRVLTTSGRGGLRVWNLITGDCVVQGPGQRVNVLHYLDGSRTLICGLGHLSFWDGDTCSYLFNYTDGLDSYPIRAVFSPDGNLLAMVRNPPGGVAVYPASPSEVLRFARKILGQA
jgi:WD40 repeat protein